MKKIIAVLAIVLLLFNTCGCVALIAGAAGGGGTAVWLSGKLTQEVNAPYERTIKATELALKSLRLEITKKTMEKNVTQIMSKYTDGRTIWIDVRAITPGSSKIEVRVGAVPSDKAAADKILKRVLRYL